jgi:hypothetical protein
MTREETQNQFLASIRKYNRSASAVLQQAMTEGGSDRVNELEAQYDSLRTAYFDLCRAKLDETNAEYETLLTQTNDASVRVSASVARLENTADVLDALTAATNLTRRLIDRVAT